MGEFKVLENFPPLISFPCLYSVRGALKSMSDVGPTAFSIQVLQVQEEEVTRYDPCRKKSYLS